MSSVVCSAPGSMMLLGEHAVVHGGRAIVAAINQRISVTIHKRDDDAIVIHSELGDHHTTLTELNSEKPFHFVMETVQLMRPHLTHGLNITIDSEFASNLGFGSSAAVLAATLGALNQLTQANLGLDELHLLAMKILHAAQGRGSGADCAASIYGGIVLYRTQPFLAERLSLQIPLTAIYCGYKTPTALVIEHVSRLASDDPKHYQALYSEIDLNAEKAFQALKHNNTKAFYECIITGQTHMQALGVSNADLEIILAQCSQQPNYHAAKISGSGLGDCVVAFGNTPLPMQDYESFTLQTEVTGIRYE